MTRCKGIQNIVNSCSQLLIPQTQTTILKLHYAQQLRTVPTSNVVSTEGPTEDTLTREQLSSTIFNAGAVDGQLNPFGTEVLKKANPKRGFIPKTVCIKFKGISKMIANYDLASITVPVLLEKNLTQGSSKVYNVPCNFHHHFTFNKNRNSCIVIARIFFLTT